MPVAGIPRSDVWQNPKSRQSQSGQRPNFRSKAQSGLDRGQFGREKLAMGLKQAPEQTGLPPAQPVELSTLVTYQTGAVVSRTLVKKNGGTVTVFAFDAGQALSEHTAPFDAIVQVLDGEVELVIGGKSVPAQAGQTVLLPAGIPHAVNAITKFKMLLIMVREPAGS